MDAQTQVDIKKCHEALNRFCLGKEIMCIPANRTDDDLMLSDALDELERTRAQLEKYERVVEAAKSYMSACKEEAALRIRLGRKSEQAFIKLCEALEALE